MAQARPASQPRAGAAAHAALGTRAQEHAQLASRRAEELARYSARLTTLRQRLLALRSAVAGGDAAERSRPRDARQSAPSAQ